MRPLRHAAGPGLAFMLFILTWVGGTGTARAQEQLPSEEIQIGISTDLVGLTSDFSGTQIAVFGTVENANRVAQTLNEYAVVVVIRGPAGDIVVRRKERVLGIWVNRAARTYRNVPSFYALASDRTLDRVAGPELLREHELGIANLSLKLYSRGTDILPAPEFADSLRQIREKRRLFYENHAGVEFLGSSLFRATLDLPSDIPVGVHTVTAYLFREGQFLASRSGTFRVEKQGLEKWLFTLAHFYSLWYGLLAVGLAMLTGWLASIIFGGARK